MNMFIHTVFYKNTSMVMLLCAFCFVMLGAFYIYGVNDVAVHTFGKEADKKRLSALKEELYALETERAHLAVGSWLEERARQYELEAGGATHFLSRDSSVAFSDN